MYAAIKFMTENKSISNKNSELTICSTYYSPESKRLLEINYEFTRKLNPGNNFTWIASDGSEPGRNNKVDQDKFLLIGGVNSTGIPEILSDKNLRRYAVTYYHGFSLMKAIPHIKTRFTVFLDVDFFIIKPHWISEIVQHMKNENLAFFGSPFHPRFFRKYRYFPCLQCLFIDLEKVGGKNVDFSPLYHEDEVMQNTIKKTKEEIMQIAFGGNRLKIGSSKDTSYGLFKKYAKSRIFRNETLKPVFKPELDLRETGMDITPYGATSFWNNVLEKFLPEKYCLLPKKTNYYTNIGFKDLGFFDASGEGWEEYMWLDKPFAFHLRQISKRISRGTFNKDAISCALKTFMDQKL